MSPAAALGRRSGPGSGSGVREKGRERDPQGVNSPFDLGKGGPQGGDSWRRRSVGGGGHGGAAVGLDGGQGEEGE